MQFTALSKLVKMSPNSYKRIYAKVLTYITSKYPLFRHKLWEKVDQEFEFKFHAGSGGTWRNSPAFMRQTEKLFTYWGYKNDQFHGKVIIDLGAGSKLRSKYFNGARIFAIEPLAERFRKLPYCDLGDAEKVFGVPAEQYVDNLDKASLVICINRTGSCL